MKAVLASKNPHKLAEIQTILSGLGVEVVMESELGLDIDVDETGTTFEENSRLKAEAVMRAANFDNDRYKKFKLMYNFFGLLFGMMFVRYLIFEMLGSSERQPVMMVLYGIV